ncbi:MAG: NAD(P)H-dependent oxidoreductase [Alkalispirochaeta sp.]
MSVLLITGHPNPGSFNHVAADRIIRVLAEEGIHGYSHDLYAEHFQPVLENEEIRRRFSFDESFISHVRELQEARGLVIVYPDWWGIPPAIIKGWVDRIFRPGIAFDYEGPEHMKKHRVPLLTGKKALICNTTDETNPLSQEPMRTIWRDRILSHASIDTICFKTLYNVRESTGRQRKAWLEEIDTIVRRLFSEF